MRLWRNNSLLSKPTEKLTPQNSKVRLWQNNSLFQTGKRRDPQDSNGTTPYPELVHYIWRSNRLQLIDQITSRDPLHPSIIRACAVRPRRMITNVESDFCSWQTREIEPFFFSWHLPCSLKVVEVIALHRSRVGPITLQDLRQGQFRELTRDEIRSLRRALEDTSR